MTIKFYNMTEEKIKVVKTIPSEALLTQTATLKSPCSLFRPVFNFEFNITQGYLPSYNYIYAVELNRYYFVDDITIIANNLYQMSCTCDVLMTYSNSIKEINAFVSKNEHYIDKYYPNSDYPISFKKSYSRTNFEIQNNAQWFGSDNILTDDEHKRFVIQCQGELKDNNNHTMSVSFGVPSIMCKQDLVAYFAQSMATSTSFLGSKTASDCVVGIYGLPLEPNGFSNQLRTLALPGAFSDVMTLLDYDCASMTKTMIKSVKWKNTIATRQGGVNYLDNPPYTEYYIAFQPFGTLQLDMTRFSISSSTFDIWIKVDVNVFTGDAYLFVSNTDNNYEMIASSNVRIDIPTSSAYYDMTGMGNAALMTALAIASEGASLPATAVAGSVVGGINGINGSVGAKCVGSVRIIDDTPRLIIEHAIAPTQEFSITGAPLYEVGQLKEYYGFTICKDFHLENIKTGTPPCYATSVELQEIERLLKTGVILHHYTT